MPTPTTFRPSKKTGARLAKLKKQGIAQSDVLNLAVDEALGKYTTRDQLIAALLEKQKAAYNGA